jgi:hypothetical protein
MAEDTLPTSPSPFSKGFQQQLLDIQDIVREASEVALECQAAILPESAVRGE